MTKKQRTLVNLFCFRVPIALCITLIAMGGGFGLGVLIFLLVLSEVKVTSK